MEFKVINKKFTTNDDVVVCTITTEIDRFTFSNAEFGVAESIDAKKFEINHDNPLHKKMTFRGIAECNENDVFDLHKGKILAECRAMEDAKRYYSNFFYKCANKASELAEKFMKMAENEASIRNANSTKIIAILLES